MTDQTIDNTLRSLEYSLRAANRSSHTRRQYRDATLRFYRWCETNGLVDQFPAQLTRHHITAWLVSLQDEGLKPATVRHLFSGLRAFFKWLEEDQAEDWPNPMRKIHAPDVPETHKDVVSAEDMGRVLKSLDACKRRRDAAIISLFYDCGLRVSELINIRDLDINWDEQEITLQRTKAGTYRVVPFSPATAKRMDAYVRHRGRVSADRFFVGQHGALTRSGVLQMVKRTFAEHGVEGIGPHDLRHTFATHFLSDPEAREGDLQTIAGWSSDRMARRYSRQGQTRRAIAAHRRLSPVERLGR